MPSNTIAARIEDFGRIDPKEAAKIEKSIKGREQAPTVAEQTGSFVDWSRVRDELGTRFDVERVPLRKLRQMRRDPMIAFGLHYRKTPLVRAQWHIEAADKNGPNAQVSGFMTQAWRHIHARYVFQHTLDFDFGWQAIVKRFVTGNPGGYYYDPSENNAENKIKPVWDEGEVKPVIWKPFVGLPPERVAPIMNDSTGEFDGIIYDQAATPTAPTTARVQQLTANQRKIDIHHTLWATNDKDSVHGSLYGYPLISHAYRFWWSYWFRWAMADRAFERMAVPPLVARHPEGDYTDTESGETTANFEIARQTADALRSNAIATVPSTLATAGLDERGTGTYEWSFEFLQVPSQNFDFLDKSFNYLDVMKLRSIWVPEQAFIEGEGGTSSRNVAEQMADIFLESQANKWEEIADHINRYILPQLLAVNFPEFVNNGGTCKIIGHGFAKQDIEMSKQLIQLIGQADPNALGLDVREMLERLNLPLKTPEDLQRDQIALQAQNALAQPPAVNGGRGQLSIAPVSQVGSGIAPGSTNGGSVPEPNSPGTTSVTGFSDNTQMVFIQPNEYIELSDDADFISSLPDSKHYTDKTMRALAVQIRKIYQGYFRELYPDFAKYVSGIQTIVLSEEFEDAESRIDLADGDRVVTLKAAKRAANKLIEAWAENSQRIERIQKSSQRVIERLVKRAIAVTRREHSIREDVDSEAFTSYVEAKAGRLVTGVNKTVKNELHSYLVNAIREGKTASEISADLQEHFDGFDKFKSDRIARSEVRDAMNAGTLLAAESAGHRYVQASDGTDFDVDCRNRNGKVFTIREAWREMDYTHTHPNCTLGFTPLARAEFSVKTVDKLPESAGDADAWFDQSTCTAYIPVELSDNDADEFLRIVAAHLAEDDS